MALMILVFAYQSGYISRLLSKHVFVVLGEISFGFYMIHQLVILYITAINTKYSLINNDLLLIFFIFIITLTGSYVSYKLIEQPANRFIKKKFSKNNLALAN